MNLNYRTVDTHAIGDPKAQQAIRIIDTTLRPIVQLLREAVVMDPDTGKPFWAAGVIPRALDRDPRGHATYGRLGEFALGTDGTLYQKTVGTEIDNHWRVLGGMSGDDDDDVGTSLPVSVDLFPNLPGVSNRLARADHHHHLDEDIAPSWTGPHRWTVPANEITASVGALNLSTTLPVPDVASSGTAGFILNVTTPTSSQTPTNQSHALSGMAVNLLPGYTGTGGSYALAFANTVAGTGTNVWAQFASAAGNSANRGIYGRATGLTSTGHNIGALYEAYDGKVNVAAGAASNQPKSSSTNVGFAAIARNHSQTDRVIGGFFGLYGPTTPGADFAIPDFATPGYLASALIADAGLAAGTSLTAAFYKNNTAGNALTQTWQWSGAGACIAIGAGIGASEIPFQIRAHASQTANLFEVASSAGTAFAALDPVGRLRMLETTTPSHVANAGFLYTKDFSGRTELCYFDSNGATGAEVRLTTTGAVTMNLANPTGTVGLSAVNGTAATAMRSDAAPPLSQAIAPTWIAAHIWAPSAASSIPVRINAHATQSVDLFFTQDATPSDNVAINNEGILRLRDVSGLTGTYPGQAAPYGGLNDYGSGFSYCILYGMFDSAGSNLTELWFDNENNTPQKLTINGRVNVDVNIDWNWQASQTFAGGATISAGQTLYVNTIDVASGTVVTFLNDISVADSDVRTGTSSGTTFGLTGHKVGFMGATPIGAYTGGGISGGFTAGAGAAVDSLSTWTGSGGVSANTYTIGDIVDALKKFGFLT